MKVKELIEILYHVDQNAEVILRSDEDLVLEPDDIEVKDDLIINICYQL